MSAVSVDELATQRVLADGVIRHDGCEHIPVNKMTGFCERENRLQI